jgi:arsenite methyltransferase
MSVLCPVGFDPQQLRTQVRATYERVAAAPEEGFHFHTGPDFAVDLLRYERSALDVLPRLATRRFAGVGNPHRVGPIAPGAVVLDHACGSGTDLLLAALAAGPAGRVVGVDITPSMLACAARAAEMAGLAQRVELHAGDFAALPVADASVDVVLSNGVLNLAPDKAQVMSEVVRVLRPGGRLYLADVVVERELDPAVRSDARLWAACIGGALTESALVAVARSAGLLDVRIVEHFDCFRATRIETRFGASLRVQAASLHARKAD